MEKSGVDFGLGEAAPLGTSFRILPKLAQLLAASLEFYHAESSSNPLFNFFFIPGPLRTHRPD